MHYPQQLVLNFMRKMEQRIPDDIDITQQPIIDLRLKLIKEEVCELEDALRQNNIIEVIDALCDLLYVTYGAAIAFGIDLEYFFDEVHENNMLKSGKLRRKDGKILKEQGHSKPNIKKVLDVGYGKI